MGNRKSVGATAVSNVMALAGQTVTITGFALTRYQIEETPGWFWTDGMFSGFAEEEEPYDVEDLI